MGIILKKNQAAYSLIIIILLSTILFSGSSLIRSPQIKQAETPETWSKPLPEHISIDTELVNWTPKYSQQVIVDGDIHLEDDDILIIENCTYILNGVLLAEDYSKVIIKDAELFIREKRKWSYLGDIVPVGYHVAFKDNSTLTVTDSSIAYLRHTVDFGFFNSSRANILGSDLSLVALKGSNKAKITIQSSCLKSLGLTDDAIVFIQDSTLTQLYPSSINPDLMKESYGATVHIKDSAINSVFLSFNEATIKLTDPLPNYFSSFSLDDDTFDGFSALFIELENATVDAFSLYAYNSQVIVENQILYQLLVTGSLAMRNTTCDGLFVGKGSFTISDSVINYYSPHHETIQTITKSNLGVIHLHSLTGFCIFDQVQADHIEGHDSDGVVSGSLTLLNTTAEPWHNKVKLERRYPVIVSEDGYAVKGANLNLINSDGTVVWASETGLYGDSKFSLTYYNQLSSDHKYINNMTAAYTLEAEYKGVTLSQPVTISSNTPIIFDFSQ